MTEREIVRRARHRLAVLRHAEEVSGNVAATCRYYGIIRNCFYKWLRRYETDGLEGLKDRSSRPHHSPRATDPEVIEKIIWLRQHYHFGSAKIAMYLQRYHDVAISASGVWRILKRLNMNRLPGLAAQVRSRQPTANGRSKSLTAAPAIRPLICTYLIAGFEPAPSGL
jgi:transposase